MNQQRHVIKRQTVEITIDRNNDVWSLQQRISRMISAQIIPLINRHCSEMSSPHHIHRIDQLELDLGELDPDNVETDFASKFSDALRRELAEQINRLESDALSRHSSSAIASHLELFSLFVRQGLLPWWADFQQAKLPENSLDYLLQEAPDALRRLLLELVRDKYALQRLICHFNDSRLLSLVELAIPTLSDFPAFLYEALIAAGGNTLMQLSGVPPSRWREQLWQTIMQTAVLANPPDRLSLFRGITTRWATALGLSHADLLENLLQGLLSKESSISDYLAITISEKPKQTISFDAEWLTLLAILNEYLPETLKSSLLTPLEAAYQSNNSAVMLAKLESWLKTHNTDLLTVLKDSLPEPLQQSLLTRLKTAHQSNDSAVILAELEAWISMHDSELPAAILLRLAVFHQRLHLAKNATSTPALLAKQATLRKTSDSRLNDVDELYIDNAGLVILWPFLNHFFERLDLIQERDFLNDDSKQRALALLQYLANEDPGSPEYQLPLNKLLCGMELEAVFHLATPLTETEKDECNSFLAAVIEQAPILNKMSISGFRGSFLLRQGILSPRDGAWLLRIERETYDVVLDRFPWEMDWVKLPWMSTSLRVEW
ncbi:MAG: hypothetical protein RLZZ419_1871 [Pseudomonadota bacterium]